MKLVGVVCQRVQGVRSGSRRARIIVWLVIVAGFVVGGGARLVSAVTAALSTIGGVCLTGVLRCHCVALPRRSKVSMHIHT